MIYKFTITPQGAVGTPFRSDTLFGHACWTMRMYEKKERFDKFIENAAEQKPELVFSDGFPSGFLPRPLMPLEQIKFDSKEQYDTFKKRSKQMWIKKDELNECNSIQWILDSSHDTGEEYKNSPMQQAVLHNVIDRFTGTSLSANGLYAQNQLWFEGIWENIDIYVVTEWSREQLSDFILKLFEIGYGRDQTAGLGKIEIKSFPEKETFPNIETEWFLSLSRAVPCSSVNIEKSFYQIEPKYGKVWSGLEKQNHPFKKVILETVPGSVLKMNKNTETAGKVLKEIHDNSSVIENCMTILYPIPQEVVEGAVV